MVHFIDRKKQLKIDILKALDQQPNLDLGKTVAMFSLETGFNEKTIAKVLKQMAELNYIKIDGDIISRPTGSSGTAVPQ